MISNQKLLFFYKNKIIHSLIQNMMIASLVAAVARAINRQVGLAIFTAIIIYFVANLYFGLRLYRHTNPCYPKKIAHNLYQGEVIKLSLVVTLMLVAIHNLNIWPLPLFISYFLLQISYFFLLSLSLKKRART